MELSSIKVFLEKYRKKLSVAEASRSELLQIILKISGVSLSEKEIVLKRGRIILHSDSITKNQIFIFKEKIIEEIKKQGIAHIYEIS